MASHAGHRDDAAPAWARGGNRRLRSAGWLGPGAGGTPAGGSAWRGWPLGTRAAPGGESLGAGGSWPAVWPGATAAHDGETVGLVRGAVVAALQPVTPAGAGVGVVRGRRGRWRIVAISGVRSTLVNGAPTLASTCWVSAPCRVRLPPQTLRVTTAGRIVRRVGGVDRRVPQKAEYRREFGGQVRGEAVGGVQRRRFVDQPTELGEQSAASGCQTMVAQQPGVAAVAEVEAGLQDALHPGGPRAARMIGSELPRSPDQVSQTGLVQRVGEAAIRRPPVAHEHAGVVGAEHGGGSVEPAAGANGVDCRLRRGEDPQPVADGADAPAGLIRRDHGTFPDLLAQCRVGRRRLAGGAMQHLREASGRNRQSALRLQQVRDLGQRHAQVRVQLDDQRDDRGAELHAGRPQRVGGLQRVADPGRAADTGSNGRPRCRSTARWGAPWGVLPDTATPHGSPQPRRRSPDRRPAPTPRGSRRPAPAAGGTPAGHSAHPLAGRDARRDLAAGPWRTGRLAEILPAARRRVAA